MSRYSRGSAEDLAFTDQHKGKMRQRRIRIIAGDRVSLEMSPYDVTRGRISFRHLDRPAAPVNHQRKFPYKKR